MNYLVPPKESIQFDKKRRMKASQSPHDHFGLDEESLAIKTTKFINSKDFYTRDLCISPIEISRENKFEWGKVGHSTIQHPND
mmetsp:Transcript_4006/g.2968  ORF Transcript_4006/g.2968 Transcript_4006/m.2968 type:complete len:83 (+) Transcript_4006:911-1159(+)